MEPFPVIRRHKVRLPKNTGEVVEETQVLFAQKPNSGRRKGKQENVNAVQVVLISLYFLQLQSLAYVHTIPENFLWHH